MTDENWINKVVGQAQNEVKTWPQWMQPSSTHSGQTLTKEKIRTQFDWIMDNCPEYSIDDSSDQVWNLYLLSVIRLLPIQYLDGELLLLRNNDEIARKQP